MTTSQRLSVSIVIPVHNRERTLIEALESLARQSRPPDEIIVVDDASSPPVPESCLSVKHLPSNIRLVRNSANLGGAASRNKGAQVATSDVIAFLDSDDQFCPTYLEEVMCEWESGSGKFSMIATGFFSCTDDMKPYTSHVLNCDLGKEDFLKRGNIVGGCSLMSVRRQEFLDLGMFAVGRGIDDLRYLIKASRCAPIRIISKPLMLYRSPSASRLANMTRFPRRQILALTEFLRTLDPEEERIARPMVRTLVANHLAMAGRRRLAVKQLFGLVKENRMITIFQIRIAIVIVLGPSLARSIMRQSALFRSINFKRYLR